MCNVAASHALLLEARRDVEQAVREDQIAAWRWISAVMIYPATIDPGSRAVILVLSSGCMTHDSWSLEGSMSNLILGLLALSGIASFWIATLCPHRAIVRNRFRFVIVTTGVLMGLILNGLILRARLLGDIVPLVSADLIQTWMFVGPLLASCINLALLVMERDRMHEVELITPVRVSSVPRPHLYLDTSVKPVLLEPYRRPVSSREHRRLTRSR
jgi:hypothetical protein